MGSFAIVICYSGAVRGTGFMYGGLKGVFFHRDCKPSTLASQWFTESLLQTHPADYIDLLTQMFLTVHLPVLHTFCVMCEDH